MEKVTNECSMKKGKDSLKKKKSLEIHTRRSKEVASFFIYHFCHIPANFIKFLKWSEVLM